MFDGLKSWMVIVMVTSLIQEASRYGVRDEPERAKQAASRAYWRAKLALDGKLRLSEKRRKQLEQLAGLSVAAYRFATLQSIPADESEVVRPVVAMLSKMPMIVVGSGDPLAIYTQVFEIAKERLGDNPELLQLLYLSEESPAPAPLRKIIQSYVDGFSSKEEAEEQLDQSTAILKKWIPLLMSTPS